jgi:hypothetical protein
MLLPFASPKKKRVMAPHSYSIRPSSLRQRSRRAAATTAGAKYTRRHKPALARFFSPRVLSAALTACRSAGSVLEYIRP